VNSKRSTDSAMLIIGLDGATFDIIDPMVEQGRLPNLAALISEGTAGRLSSTIPMLSAPAWSAFMTGQNPGQSGIFDFRTYDPSKYTFIAERVVTADVLQGRTFWDVLGEYGLRVAVLTVPVTYPPWQVNGVMLAGFPCPDGEMNYTYPPEWAAELTERYTFAQGHFEGKLSEDTILEQEFEMIERRAGLALTLLRKHSFDVLTVVFGATDRTQHEFWKYTDPAFPSYHSEKRARYQDAICSVYEKADREIGKLLDAVGKDRVVLVMSDHGAGPHPMRFFHTNSWLREKGYLALKRESDPVQEILKKGISLAKRIIPHRDRLRRLAPVRMVEQVRTVALNLGNIDWSDTKAYRFRMYGLAEGIEINLKGRQPKGVVTPGAEYEALREKLISELREVRDPNTDRPIAEAVYTREELYSGPYVERAPDIVLLFREEYEAGRGVIGPCFGPVPIEVAERISAKHRMHGVFIAQGTGIRRGASVKGLRLIDIAPTVLYSLGMPIPDDMEGRVAMDIFEPAWVDGRQVSYVSRQASAEQRSPEMSSEDEEEMRRKLEGLGYL